MTVYNLVDGDIKRTEGGKVTPYLTEHEGKDVLNVMDGGAYYRFELTPLGLHRLAEEATRQMGKHIK